MSPHAVSAYRDNLYDPDILSPSTGVIANFLESCARQISGYYGNTRIPGTPYTGVDVDLCARANPYAGTPYNDRGRHPVTVGLSVSHSHLEFGVSGGFRIQLTLDAAIYLPFPPKSNSLEEAREFERAYRDMRNHAAVVEGLYLALMEIPFYSDGHFSGQVIPVESMEHSFPTTPVISATYVVPVRVSRSEVRIERLDVDTELNGDPNHYSWSYSPQRK